MSNILLKKTFLVLIVLYSACSPKIVEGGCYLVDVTKEYLTTYIGWKNEIPCSLMISSVSASSSQKLVENPYYPGTNSYQLYESYLYDQRINNLDELVIDNGNSRNGNLTCEIRRDNSTLLLQHNTTYAKLKDDEGCGSVGYCLPNTANGTTNYTIKITTPYDNCLETESFQLNFTKFQPVTCQDYVKQSTLQLSPVSIGSFKLVECQPYIDEFIKGCASENITYEWQRNCTTLPNQTQSQLEIPSIGYKDAGIYTCSVSYNGMTRYIHFFEVCVAYNYTIVKPTLRCNNSMIYKKSGEDVMFKCFGYISRGIIRQNQFYFQWQKKMSDGSNSAMRRCFHTKVSHRSSNNTPHEVCTFQYTNIDPKHCFLHEAKEAELIDKMKAVPVQFKIKNMQPKDYGSYVISLKLEFLHIESVAVDVFLRPHPRPQKPELLLTSGSIVGICLGLFGLICIVMISLWYYRGRRKGACV